ncbi:uncharacterized protein N7483_006737 [Penicillium malachiteum]|uniref:uncharacterized protein n=1 Tax=Penicillium malachiteum TaxID=1324776 RepID=UPI002547D6E8|nr:uncharacterized protein N7483_006737 [Penicillium malachiteum]KAJ5725380.1 hypothetical protein N7483_006737 [Penicillium malachiteum]
MGECWKRQLDVYAPPRPSLPRVESSSVADKEPVLKRQLTEPSQAEPEPKRQAINPQQNDQSSASSSFDRPVSTPQTKQIEVPSKKLKIPSEDLKRVFSKYLVVPDAQVRLKHNLALQNHNASEDFRPVFFGHVRLYIQADKYCIDVLRNIVLYHMFLSLGHFKLFETALEGIAELVRFVYENTHEDHEGSTDAMRNLVTRYVVSVVGQIGQTDSFQDLLNEGGPFVTEFWKLSGIWRDHESSFTQTQNGCYHYLKSMAKHEI